MITLPPTVYLDDLLRICDGDAPTKVARFEASGITLGQTRVFSFPDVSGTLLVAESDPVFGASPASGIAAGDISNWNTAYGWGNHASVGYLTAEADTLASVVARGANADAMINVGVGNTLTLASGSITDSTGAISFGNENLSTTGDILGGKLTIDNISLNASTITLDAVIPANLTIRNADIDKDIILRVNDGGSTVTVFTVVGATSSISMHGATASGANSFAGGFSSTIAAGFASFAYGGPPDLSPGTVAGGGADIAIGQDVRVTSNGAASVGIGSNILINANYGAYVGYGGNISAAACAGLGYGIVLSAASAFGFGSSFTNSTTNSIAFGISSIAMLITASQIDLKKVTLCSDKLAFTQTDMNEFIDSLADGYMDYRATLGHRFNNDILPATDNMHYLGKNDDDSPAAWKGLILKDQTDGKYYRIELNSGAISIVDLTD